MAFGPTETESHGYIQILWKVYENVKLVSVMIFGEIFFDIVNNMHFWGTLKLKKFCNVSIKVHVDESCSTSVRHRWKARSS